MSAQRKSAATSPKAAFSTTLDRHGYPFQYSVIRKALELRAQQRSWWDFEASEFPVEVQGHDTRIDIVFRRNLAAGGPPYHLVCECKRANPALSQWCFLRAPYWRSGSPTAFPTMEAIGRNPEQEPVSFVRDLETSSDKIYQIAVEAKTGAKGDAGGSRGRGEIEEATTQVLRGLNGFIELLARKGSPIDHPHPTRPRSAVLVPTIFTTASLWSSEADVSEADLATGQLKLTDGQLAQRDWLWLEYNVSPGLKHCVRGATTDRDEAGSLAKYLKREHARCVAIVSSSGIESFLCSGAWQV